MKSLNNQLDDRPGLNPLGFSSRLLAPAGQPERYAKRIENMNRPITIFAVLALALSLCLPICSIAADSHVYKKPEDVIAWVYRDFAFDAIMQSYWKNASLIEQPKSTLLLYFTEELASLILEDRRCVKETHEICNLDFDPIFASQDPGASDLKISPADKSNTVHVEFTYPGNGEKIRLVYKVQKTDSGWRIRDIIYSDFGSLRKLLSDKK
jgi:hypothetical protein